MNTILKLASALALAGLSSTAFAADGHWFVRGEIGRSHDSFDVSGSGSGSDTDNAYSLRTGYWFNQNFALEGFYSNFFDKTSSDGVTTTSLKLSAIGLGVVGKKNFGPDGNGFFIDGRLGVARGKVDASVTGLGSASQTSTKPYFGAGVGYDFSKRFGLSLNWDHHKGSTQGVSITSNVLTLGGEYRF